jgi:hypothetical protein
VIVAIHTKCMERNTQLLVWACVNTKCTKMYLLFSLLLRNVNGRSPSLSFFLTLRKVLFMHSCIHAMYSTFMHLTLLTYYKYVDYDFISFFIVMILNLFTDDNVSFICTLNIALTEILACP